MCFHYLVVLPAFTTEILSIVIQSLNYINPTYETGKQFVRIKSVANLLNAFQQLTICYIAYNLARRTSYLLQVEQNLQTEVVDDNEHYGEEAPKPFLEEYNLQEKNAEIQLAYDCESSTADGASAYKRRSSDVGPGSFDLGVESRNGSAMVDPIIAQFSVL